MIQDARSHEIKKCTFLLSDKQANILFLLSFSAFTDLFAPEHEGNDIFRTSVTILQ
jgi:hypothetical protein